MVANAFSQGSTGDYEDVPLSNMRKTIAKRLSESKRTIPHYYLTSEIFIDDLLRFFYILCEFCKLLKIKLQQFVLPLCI